MPILTVTNSKFWYKEGNEVYIYSNRFHCVIPLNACSIYCKRWC